MNRNQLITLSILLVEDDPIKIEKIVALIKTTDNIRLEVVKSQIDALEFLGLEKFDLLILDMQLPLRDKEEPEVDGGEKILVELEVDESLQQPSTIIALTQYENSQNWIREHFSDIAAVKFDISSSKWQEAISRTVARITKSKGQSKSIVYCEGINANYYNSIGISNIEFRGLIDCRAIYLAAKNEKDKYALRDRDFLTKNEISRLQLQHKNYFILNYYCFENYVFHPDNIKEAYPEFDKQSYINDLVAQKNKKLFTIIQDYKISRAGYLDFNDNEKKNMDSKPEDDIVACLQQDELEVFYPYFDMAGKKDKGNTKSYDKSHLMSHNLNVDRLVRTNWFRDKFNRILTI